MLYTAFKHFGEFVVAEVTSCCKRLPCHVLGILLSHTPHSCLPTRVCNSICRQPFSYCGDSPVVRAPLHVTSTGALFYGQRLLCGSKRSARRYGTRAVAFRNRQLRKGHNWTDEDVGGHCSRGRVATWRSCCGEEESPYRVALRSI